MSRTRAQFVQSCYISAGIIFLAETVFGCIAVLGIGFDSLQDIMLDLSLTMAFPLFLISFLNRAVALAALWIFFVAQWIDMCLVSRPPTLLNPLDGWHGSTLLVGIVLFSTAQVFHQRKDISAA
jgi:hypothetical protein